MTEEAHKLISAIQQMEESLVDEKANGQYSLDNDDLQVTYPLNRCLAFLREQHSAVSKLHRQRFEQVKSTLSLVLSELHHCTNSLQSLSRPLNRIRLTLNPLSLPSNFLQQRLVRQSRQVSISRPHMLLHSTTSSQEYTKSTTGVLSLLQQHVRRSLSSGLSLERPRPRPILALSSTIASHPSN